MPDHTIESVSQEQRVFPPPEEFSRAARIPSYDAYAKMYKRSIDDPEGFFREQAKELHWSKEPTQILEWKPPFAKWFADGTLNIADNCLDRHVSGARADKTAIIWEGEPGEVQTLTYR
jgi:acetyl-CoA synthetase